MLVRGVLLTLFHKAPERLWRSAKNLRHAPKEWWQESSAWWNALPDSLSLTGASVYLVVFCVCLDQLCLSPFGKTDVYYLILLILTWMVDF